MTEQFMFGGGPLTTNDGILVKSAFFTKTFQNNTNSIPKVPITWDAATWNNIAGLSKISSSQFQFDEIGYYLLLAELEAFSPTSKKFQVQISTEINTIPQPQLSYTGLTVATDFNSSVHVASSPVIVPGTIIEFFGKQSGDAGVLDLTGGSVSILRLGNTI